MTASLVSHVMEGHGDLPPGLPTPADVTNVTSALSSGNPRCGLPPSPDGPFGAFRRTSETRDVLAGGALLAEAPRNGGQTFA